MSRIILDSICEATANAILDGIFAFIIPVITFAEGLCVAITRCIPAARAICAIRHIYSSTSFAATSIRSASSSITTTIRYIGSRSGSFLAASLYASISFTPTSAKRRYLFIISLTAHCNAPAAFLGSVTTGIKRCGIPLYPPSSIIFGSIIISLTSSGDAL